MGLRDRARGSLRGGASYFRLTQKQPCGQCPSARPVRTLHRMATPSPALSSTMNAVVYDRYGDPSELHLTRVRRPSPARGQITVRVEATSLNALDRRLLRADPFLARLANGLLRPTKMRVLGADVAGVVEAVGEGVRGWSVGDRVFGDCSHHGLGAFAESVCLPEGAVVRIPEGMGFVEAASLPLAAGTAVQAVRERARLEAGQRVLVQGAGGGVGAHVIQIAKAHGARVTAVCGPGSIAAARSLGADEVIDRTSARGIGADGSYDVIFGVNGHRPLSAYLRALAPGGTYVMIGGDSRQLFEALLFGSLRGLLARRRVEVLTMSPSLLGRDLAEICALYERGALRPVVDHVLPLAGVATALRQIEAGTLRGKVVLDARGFEAATALEGAADRALSSARVVSGALQARTTEA